MIMINSTDGHSWVGLDEIQGGFFYVRVVVILLNDVKLC